MIDLVNKAGWVGWPLVFCSVLALTVILERLWALASLRRLEERAFLVLQMALEKGDLTALRDPAIAPAPVTVVLDSLSEMRSAGEETLQRAAEIALSLQRLRLRRFLGTLATIGSTAPFIGLFGTVWGIREAFGSMSGPQANAGVDNGALMRGISEALSATALGLLVAVPAVIAYNYFVGRVAAEMLFIHNHVARLVPALRHSLQPPAEREHTHAR